MKEDEKIFKQLLDAVADLVNGEGDYGRIDNVSPLDDMDGVAIELNDNSEGYRQAFMEHIKVLPFGVSIHSLQYHTIKTESLYSPFVHSLI